MGLITLKYDIGRLVVPPSIVMNEIEYGTTFALYHDREKIIPLLGSGLQWISWEMENTTLILKVDDDFLGNDYVFEKLLVAFLHNLLDFGELRLVSIDLSDSFYFQYINDQYRVPKYFQVPRKNLLLGTIFKPYYHLSLVEKIEMVKRFTDMGIDLIKEDETFFASENKLLQEARAIQSAIQRRGHYIPNVTHYVHDYQIIEKLLNSGIEIVMVDFLVTGFRPILRLKQKFPEICVWGHRVGYWALAKFISMEVLGTLAVLAGIDFLHIGTPNNDKDAENSLQLVSRLRNMRPQFAPVFTKTTPEILRGMAGMFDGTTVFMACGYFRDEQTTAIDWEKVKTWASSAK